MILIAAVAAGLTAALIRTKLTGRRLRTIELRHSWLVVVAVIPQLLVFQISAVGKLIPEALVPYVLVGSQALLLGFAALNFKKRGMSVMGVGLLANFLAIVFNGGWMPVSPETVRRVLPALPADFPLENRRLGFSKDWIIPNSEMQLSWLADRFTLPGWFPYRVAFSWGDIFIAIGAFVLLWSLSNPE